MSCGILTVMQEVHHNFISSIVTAVPFEVFRKDNFLHGGTAFVVLDFLMS